MITFRCFPFLYLPFLIRSCSPLLASSSILPRTVWPHTAGSPWYVVYVHVYVFLHTYTYTYTRMCMYVHLSLYVYVFMCACIYTALHPQSHSFRTHPFYSYPSSLHSIPMLCHLTYPLLSYIPQHLILLYPILYYIFCPCPILRNRRNTFITFHILLNLSFHHRILSFFSS